MGAAWRAKKAGAGANGASPMEYFLPRHNNARLTAGGALSGSASLPRRMKKMRVPVLPEVALSFVAAFRLLETEAAEWADEARSQAATLRAAALAESRGRLHKHLQLLRAGRTRRPLLVLSGRRQPSLETCARIRGERGQEHRMWEMARAMDKKLEEEEQEREWKKLASELRDELDESALLEKASFLQACGL